MMNPVEEFVKKEMAKEILNAMYGIKGEFYMDMRPSKQAIEYAKADAQFTFELYRRKVEQNMKEEKMKNIKSFFEKWCPCPNEVLFILFKNGKHSYYDLTGLNLSIVTGDMCLYIEDEFYGCYDRIAYTNIEDFAVGMKNLGESALSAIPDWFEKRINEYDAKLKEEQKMKDGEWGLYYARNSSDNDEVLIAHNLDDAIVFCKEVGFTSPVYIAEADSKDKYVKSSCDGGSILLVTERMDGTACFATQKYAIEIKRAKENEEKENKTMPERNVQELLEEFDTEELVTEVKRRKEDESWYGRFEQGMYYKVYDERKKDTAFVILRFIGFDEDCRAFALFENVYDNNMLWIPNPRIYRCDIDRYTITKLRDGMVTTS